jgi:Spy/CpxP family protein refolding chaperone
MKSIWKTLVLVLLLGAVIGAGAAWWIGEYGPCAKGRVPYATMVERFSKKLDLTPDQQRAIAAILEENRQKIKALRAEIRPKFEEIRQSTREEIRQHLAPEQQVKFDAMQAEWDAKRKPPG